LEPNDVDARQTKLFLLLQTEKYNDALNLIDSDTDQSQHSYERAYSLYRLQRESDARTILGTIKQENGENDRGVIHLEAQLASFRVTRNVFNNSDTFLQSYREGCYDEAFELYNQLLDTAEPVRSPLVPRRSDYLPHISKNSEEHSDILTNLQASQKHVDFINRGFLQVLDALPTSITSTLETAPPPVQPTTAALVSAAALASSPLEAQNAVPAQKKVRMKRVPAGVVPGVTPPPDPERWLKKSERSTFGHSRRRKGAGGGGATQGSASLDAAPPASGAASKSSGNKAKKKK
jgi:signal recognition particle subunit SRP72